jgi:hypothetical protein
MAATLTLTAASQFALKYLYVYDGAGSKVATKTQAVMLTDLGGFPQSPLLAALNVGTDPLWDALPQGAQVSLYLTVNTSTTEAGRALIADFAVAPRTLSVEGVDAEPSSAMVEVRFHHTYER